MAILQPAAWRLGGGWQLGCWWQWTLGSAGSLDAGGIDDDDDDDDDDDEEDEDDDDDDDDVDDDDDDDYDDVFVYDVSESVVKNNCSIDESVIAITREIINDQQ